MTDSNIEVEDLLNSCPECGSQKTVYDSSFDFWRCEQCEAAWSDGKNDPDYNEDSLEANEAIAEQNIEQIQGWHTDPRDCPPAPGYPWGWK
jgi:ribosomal protein L37AE/L43A